MSLLSKAFRSIKDAVHSIDPVAKLTDKELGTVYDKLKDFSDFELSKLTDVAHQLKSEPGRILYGSFDPISTKLWNKLLGTHSSPIINQLGGPTQENYANARERGVSGVAGTESIHDVIGTVAGIWGGYGAGHGLSALASGAGATGGGAGGAGATAAPEITGGVTGAAETGAGAGAGLGGATASAIPEVTVTATPIIGGGGGGGLSGAMLGAGIAGNAGINALGGTGTPASSAGTNTNPLDPNYNAAADTSPVESGGGTGTSSNFFQDILKSFGGGSGTSSSGTDLSKYFKYGSDIYGLYSAYQQQQMAKDAFKGSDPFGPYRGYYAKQLQDLMSNPSAITEDPAYKFQFEQGQQAVERSMAAKGFLGSGNEAIALTQYGQGFAQNYLTQKEQFLSSLAGAGISPNFGPALSGMNMGINTASSALASLGYDMTTDRANSDRFYNYMQNYFKGG